MIFIGTDTAGGQELWRTDGTAAGTSRIADINPGLASSGPQLDRVVGDTYYFTADDGVHGRELWRTDGTKDGTVRLTDINPGRGSANPGIEYAGADTLYVAADDGVHGIEPWRVDVPTNSAPGNLALSFDPPSVDEGATVTLNGRFTDPDTADTHAVHILWGDGSADVLSLAAGLLNFSATHVYLDDAPSGASADTAVVQVTVSDGPTRASADAPVVVRNVAPQSVTITRIAPTGLVGPVAPGAAYAPGTQLDLAGSFADPGTLDTHTFQWVITSDSLAAPIVIPGTLPQGARSISSAFRPTAAGVYHVKLVVTDDDGGTGSADTAYGDDASFVVYDRSAGFVTGGGWIDSPAGAYAADPALTGKVTFGFESKYHKGATLPTGNTEFQLKLANLNFKWTDFDWLVVAGDQARLRGSGTINGRGDYAFLLTAIDGGRTAPDQLRIRIWDQDTGATLYDNGMGKPDDAPGATAPLGGGSIVLHA
jgi:ELWxxDGT repeat protein